jgi:hypothetical protein
MQTTRRREGRESDNSNTIPMYAIKFFSRQNSHTCTFVLGIIKYSRIVSYDSLDFPPSVSHRHCRTRSSSPFTDESESRFRDSQRRAEFFTSTPVDPVPRRLELIAIIPNVPAWYIWYNNPNTGTRHARSTDRHPSAGIRGESLFRVEGISWSWFMQEWTRNRSRNESPCFTVSGKLEAACHERIATWHTDFPRTSSRIVRLEAIVSWFCCSWWNPRPIFLYDTRIVLDNNIII